MDNIRVEVWDSDVLRDDKHARQAFVSILVISSDFDDAQVYS